MSEQCDGGDLLFAWLTPIEAHVDKKLHRPRSPSLSSPLLRAKTAIRRTFSAGQRAQRQKEQVREAVDACWWLKAAGFPQYVQLFEDGHFPLSISKFHVEKDHNFLLQTELETLIRRLNVLNRSTVQMEEILNSPKREPIGDLTIERALSDRWIYRQRWQNWGRKSHTRRHSDGSEGGNLADTSLPSSSGAPNSLVVSELRGSLTDLSREVKTYSFSPSEETDVPPIVVDPPGTTRYASTSSPSPTKPFFPPPSPPVDQVMVISENGEGGGGGGVRLSGHSIDSEADSEIFDHRIDFIGEEEDSFASGLCSVFDNSMQKLRSSDKLSHSLPNVFSLEGHDVIDTSCISTTTDENTSTSVSVTSMLGDSASALDEEDPVIKPVTSSEQLTSALFPVSVVVNGHHGEGRAPYERTSTLPASFKMASPSPAPNGRVGGGGGGVFTKRWSGPGDAVGSYDSGSEVGETEREGRSRLSPVAGERGGWMSISYAHPPRQRSPGSPSEESKDMTKVHRRKKRGSSGHGRSKSRWHSFQKSHCYQQLLKPVRPLVPIEELSAGQISVLQKLNLVKLTAMLELYGCPVNIVRCLRRRQKQPEIKGRNVFGSSLSENVRRYGNPLPPTILCALQHLHDNGLETVGIFRRAAGKSRVGVLRGIMEANPEYCDFEGYSVYDVADLVKHFFRELPEPLLTVRFSELLTSIQDVIPPPLRVQMVRCVMLLLPDENRYALHHLLSLLGDIASRTDINQMDAKNLSLCFSPSIFSLSSTPSKSLTYPANSFPRIPSIKRHTIHNSSSPLSLSSTKEVTETVTSSECLQLMITHRREIFQVAADQLQVVKFSYLELSVPVPYHNLAVPSDQYGMGASQSFLDSCITTILKESRRRFKDWMRSEDVRGEGGEGVEVSHVSVGDGVPLWVWRGTTDIHASPKTVFERIWYQRHVWDKTMVSSWKVATLDPQTEVFQYVTRATPPLCDRDHCLMRVWHRDVPTGRYVIVATSVSHPQAELRAGVRAVHLASHFLLQPCPHGTQVTALSREDWRGHSSEYNNRSLGPYLVSSTLSMLRNSFREPDFLETPV